MTTNSTRISIAILALGGQGGGVLADWIQSVARENGWIAQGTSVPGVAQRTGSTVYYVELARGDDAGKTPIMAQMPMPGDVDVVVASELMETGRALLRGFSTAERTTLIGSTHRIYAIGEKSRMADGRGSGERILEAANERSKRFIGFDMEAAGDSAGSVISAVMFGALAGSDALPFSRQSFEDAIRASGIAIDSNLAGFAEGYRRAGEAPAMPVEETEAVPQPSTPRGRELADKARSILPAAAHDHAMHGLKRLMDYQDAAYADLYLDRLSDFAGDDVLAAEAARHLALWMSYDDTIRVADLKIRASRTARVHDDIKAQDGQIVEVTEYMHPRLREVGETLPAPIGKLLLGNGIAARMAAPFFREGRHVRTSSIGWFLMLRLVAGMRRMRRSTVRYAEEQERITAWLDRARAALPHDPAMATEWIRCQRLIKGYGDTFERGLRNLANIEAAFDRLPEERRTARWISDAREAALGDDAGKQLATYLDDAA